MRKLTSNNPYLPYSAQISQKQDEHNIYAIMKTYMLLYSFCFCEILALCVSWITYDHLYYTPYLVSWVLFGSLVPAVCNRTSCAQVHELLQSECGDKRGAHYFNDMYIYIYIYIYHKTASFINNTNQVLNIMYNRVI